NTTKESNKYFRGVYQVMYEFGYTIPNNTVFNSLEREDSTTDTDGI
ncbi:1689_t:CDS:2, partial [Gigaspora rosea]